jgi:hypothetical protein
MGGKSEVEVTSPDMWGFPPTMFHKEWKSFLIHFHNFAEHPTTKGHSLESPEFTCNGQKWSLRLYPCGNTIGDSSDDALLFSESCCFNGDVSNSGCVSLYLNHRSRGSTTATFEVKIINKFGDTLKTRRSSSNRRFDSCSSSSGWSNVIKLSDVLDESKDILDSNGTLTVVVSMKPTQASSSENELDGVYLGLPSEPSWMKPPVILGTLSNEGVEVDRLGISHRSVSIDCCSTHSVDPLDGVDAVGSLLSVRDSWTDTGHGDNRDDDEVSKNGGSVEDDDEVSNDGGSVEDDDVSVSTPDMWGFPPTMFHKEWKSFLIHFHNFAEHPTTKGRSLESPEFTCNGQKWSLRLYPCGNTSDSDNGCISLYLNHRSRGSTTATFEVKIINKFGDTLKTRRSSSNRLFDSCSSSSGWSNVIKLSDVLDESKDILDSNGMLTIVVSMKNAPQHIDPHSELVLKKLVVKCLLKNQLLPENTIIGLRGKGKVLKLRREPSLGTLEKQQLSKTRDPPELVGQTTTFFHNPQYFVRQPETHVRVLQPSSRDVLSQPPRPDEVRYQLSSPSGIQQPPKSDCSSPVQNDFYSSQQTFSSVPVQYHVGKRGLSSHAMDRRRHYKKILLQQQLTQTQAHLAQAATACR